MIFLDIIITTIVLYGGYKGYQNGMISQLLGFMIFLIIFYKGVYIYHFSEELVSKLNISIRHSKFFIIYSVAISFIFITILSFLSKKIIELILIITFMKPIDKFLGGILGMVKYFFYISICIFLIKETNQKTNIIPYNFFENSFSNIINILIPISKKEFLFYFNKFKLLIYH